MRQAARDIAGEGALPLNDLVNLPNRQAKLSRQMPYADAPGSEEFFESGLSSWIMDTTQRDGANHASGECNRVLLFQAHQLFPRLPDALFEAVKFGGTLGVRSAIEFGNLAVSRTFR